MELRLSFRATCEVIADSDRCDTAALCELVRAASQNMTIDSTVSVSIR